MEEQQNNKELGLIDILQVFGQWIVAGLKKLVEWCMFLLFFAFKQWKILTAAILALGIYSLVTYKRQDAQFEANMIVRCNAMETSQMKSFFDNYSALLSNDIISERTIKEKTSLTPEQRKNIKQVDTYFCIDDDRDGVMDEIDRGHKIRSSAENLDSLNLCVQVLFADLTVLDDVKRSLAYYLEHTPYVVKMNEARLRQQAKRRDFILHEIGLLDTIQKRAYGESDEASSMMRSGGVIVDNRRVLSIYEDKEVLWSLCEVLEEELKTFGEPITIVEDFVVQQQATNTLMSILKKNVIFGSLVIYLLLLLWRYIRNEKDKYITKL